MRNVLLIILIIELTSCRHTVAYRKPIKQISLSESKANMDNKLKKYVPVTLSIPTVNLSDNERNMLPILINAADIMNQLFWEESYGNKSNLLNIISDEDTKRFIEINYGPWDRLDSNKSFIDSIGAKPLGANFYPKDMAKEEFYQLADSTKNSQYTFIRRTSDGGLKTIPYHIFFKNQVSQVADLLIKASKLAEDNGLKKYLELRANALLTDDYRASDLAWIDMKTNMLDIVIGPIETYEDQLFGLKASHEAYVLIKDIEWSKKLARYTSFLPELQTNLPVDTAYKAEIPGTDSDLNAYDVIYYAGNSNAGSKTIAINLPNDEEVQLQKGTRRLQLKNAMKAKFDKILLPIANILIDPSQRKYVNFNAFFTNTMFHEVAHGLGIKNTINGKGTVRSSLKELASAFEEGKADILGLYMVQQLQKKGEISGDMKTYMTTFMTSIFRSVRFGDSSAHGKANMVRFNYFKEKGALTKNENGTYAVNYNKMNNAIKDLSRLILTLQGNGDYDGVAKLFQDKGIIQPDLQLDLDKLNNANIPVDVIFNQGIKLLNSESIN